MAARWEYLTVLLTEPAVAAGGAGSGGAGSGEVGSGYTIRRAGLPDESGHVGGCSAWIRLVERLRADGWRETEVPLGPGITYERELP